MTKILAETGGAASGTVKPFIASDEEGGRVQRFKNLIYPIPSATEMGQKPNEEITEITAKYAEKLHKFGVDMVFAPVLGLTYPGNYLANDYRTFAADPEAVFEKSQAWAAGFTKCNVIPVIKHWPGTGTAANTHTGSSLVSPLAELEAKDMLPFNKWFEAGTPAVMVGHVGIPGLTEENTPASLSEKAYTYLREKAGEDTIIITDSLLMDAASKSIGLTPQQAAVKAIKSGADMALITSYGTDYSSYIEAIITAIDTGEIEKSQAIKSAARILKLKAQKGLSY
jgi:beta-N-acetylhexosaminidase